MTFIECLVSFFVVVIVVVEAQTCTVNNKPDGLIVAVEEPSFNTICVPYAVYTELIITL